LLAFCCDIIFIAHTLAFFSDIHIERAKEKMMRREKLHTSPRVAAEYFLYFSGGGGEQQQNKSSGKKNIHKYYMRHPYNRALASVNFDVVTRTTSVRGKSV
jgi:hypothetical protein